MNATDSALEAFLWVGASIIALLLVWVMAGILSGPVPG